jgi:hypothetical protein
MKRSILLLTLIASGGCKHEDDGLGESVKVEKRAARCLTMSNPPRERCEQVAKSFAVKAYEAARKAPGETIFRSELCKASLEVGLRFAHGSSEVDHIRNICCTAPNDFINVALVGLCSPDFPKIVTLATLLFNAFVRCARDQPAASDNCERVTSEYLDANLSSAG